MPLGLPIVQYRFGHSIEEARSETRVNLGHSFVSKGEILGAQVYEVFPLRFALPSAPNKQGAVYGLFLSFRGGQLDEFELRPRDETRAPFTGRADVFALERELVALLNISAGGEFHKSKWQREVDAPVKMDDSPLPGAAPLGFVADHRTWSDQNVHFRLLTVWGNAAKTLGIVRLQGRRSAPISTPLEVEQMPRNGDRAALALAVFQNLHIPDSIRMGIYDDPNTLRRAPKPFLQRLAEMPKPRLAGDVTGVPGLRFNMSRTEVMAHPFGQDGLFKVAPSARGESLQAENVQLVSGSPRRFVLQLWFGKNGLREFELRPMREKSGADLIGNASASDFLDDVKSWTQWAFGVKGEQWWQEHREVKTVVKTWRSESREVEVPASGGMVFDGAGANNPGAPAGYRSVETPGYTTTVKRNTRVKFDFPVFLGFAVAERAFDLPHSHFRQTHLFGQHGGARVNVIRVNGRSEGGSYVPVLNKKVKNQNVLAANREVLRYYDVTFPGAS